MSPAPSASQPLPNQSSRKSSIVKLNVNPSKLSDIQSAPPNPSPVYNAMSDGEATGGEGSDGGARKAKKIKLTIKGQSPMGSRAGSPAPGKAGSVGGSRAGSPAAPQSMDSIFPCWLWCLA
jgi:transcription initiation factor TFIIF subunit alpha